MPLLHSHADILIRASILVLGLALVGVNFLVRARRSRGSSIRLDPRTPMSTVTVKRSRDFGWRPFWNRLYLFRLETQLRNAILSPHARERLVNDAMRRNGGDRRAAIRKVLSDLEQDNTRWI